MFPSEENPHWASLTRDKVGIMLSARNSNATHEKPIMTGSLYFYPENIDQLWEELKNKVEVTYEIETFDYGMRESGILDQNGYLLQFGQDMKKNEDLRA